MPILLLLLRHPEIGIYILSETDTSPLLLPAGRRAAMGKGLIIRSGIWGELVPPQGKLSVCLPPGWKMRVGDPEGRSRGQASGCQGPRKGPAALAGRQPHPDVVGGERDEAALPRTLTGWVTFAGFLQIAQNQGSGKGNRARFPSGFRRGGGCSFGKGNPAKGAEIRKDQKPQWHRLTHGCAPPTSLAASRRVPA